MGPRPGARFCGHVGMPGKAGLASPPAQARLGPRCLRRPVRLGPGTWTGGQARFRSWPSPAAWPASPAPPPPQAPSISPGFRAAADLLSPVALLRFSAVARGQDPPAGDGRKLGTPFVRAGLSRSQAAGPLQRSPCSPGLGRLRRLGLVYFLYLFLFSGLEFTLSFLAHQRFQFSR